MNHDVSQTVNRCLLCGSEMMVGGTCLHCQSKLTANPVAKINQLERRIISLERENERLVKALEKARDLVELEERSVFRQNNPYGKEVKELLSIIQSLLTEIQKAKGRE